MDVKLATLIKLLNIMDVIFSGFTVWLKTVRLYKTDIVQHITVRQYISDITCSL